MNRREFVKSAATCAAVAGLMGEVEMLHANPLGLPIGCQTWPVRDLIAKDFPGTIKMLAGAGFTMIELCSPYGYSDAGFGGLKKYKGAELRRILSDAGVGCISSHFGMEALRKDQDAAIAWAKDVGLKQMLVASLGGPEKPTMDDVKRAADEYNKIAEKAAQAGIQQGLHNEGFESSMVDGKRTYDVLFELLDPKLVKFQFQVSEIAEGLTRRSISRSIRGGLSRCTCRDGKRARRRSWPWVRTRWTGRRFSGRRRWAGSRIILWRWSFR